jgi:hypothetical protein
MQVLKKYIIFLIYSTTFSFIETVKQGGAKLILNTVFDNEKAVSSGFCVTLYILGLAISSGVPRKFVREGGGQKIRLRTERTGVRGR